MINRKMNTSTARAILFVLVFFFVSCKKESNEDLRIEPLELSASETDLIPDKNTKSVSTTITIKGFDAVDFIMVTRTGGDPYAKKIERNELAATFEYIYKIQRRDPEKLDRKSTR